MRFRLFSKWVLPLFALALASNSLLAADEINYDKLIADKSPSLVVVKYLLKINGPGGADQSIGGENEISGIVVDPKGVILCSNEEMSGYMNMIGGMMGQMDEKITTTPSEFKVRFGEGSDELAATLIARDPELDLAWLQIKDAGDRKFAFVDFEKSSKAKIGDRLIWIGQAPAFYGYATGLDELRVVSLLKRPRELYMHSGASVGLNLAIFTPAGEPVGLTVVQMEEKGKNSEDPFSMFMAMTQARQKMATLILPGAQVAKATKRALASGGKEEKIDAAEKAGKSKEK